EGEPVHEVLSPPDLPDVIATGAELVQRFNLLQTQLVARTLPYAGHDSIFIGRIEAGEIYNQVPTTCRIHGTRRWVTPNSLDAVQTEIDQILAELAQSSGTKIVAEFTTPGDAFSIAATDPLVQTFQAAYNAFTGLELLFGGKPFVDDGNTFAALAGIPAL